MGTVRLNKDRGCVLFGFYHLKGCLLVCLFKFCISGQDLTLEMPHKNRNLTVLEEQKGLAMLGSQLSIPHPQSDTRVQAAPLEGAV